MARTVLVTYNYFLARSDHSNSYTSVLFPGANHSQLHEERFGDASDDHYFPGATHLLLQNEIHPRSTRYALEHAHGAITILNPSPLPSPSQLSDFPWSLVDWLIVNEGEAEDLFRAMTDQDSRTWSSTVEMLQLMSSLIPFRKTNIVCTLGARGVVAVLPPPDNPDANVSLPFVTYIPAATLETGVKDTTGAGDCFTGYFVQGLMGLGPNGITEKDIEIVLRFAAQVSLSLTFITDHVFLLSDRLRGCLLRDQGQSTVYLM